MANNPNLNHTFTANLSGTLPYTKDIMVIILL